MEPASAFASASQPATASARSRQTEEIAEVPASFRRLVDLYRSNEALLVELRRTEALLARARAYLTTDGANVALGRAQVIRLRERKSALLARLRADRIAAAEEGSIPYTQNPWA